MGDLPGRLYNIGTPEEVITETLLKDAYNVDAEIVNNNRPPHVILRSIIS